MARSGRKVQKSPPKSADLPISAVLSTDERRAFDSLVAETREAGTFSRVNVQLIVEAARTIVILERAHAELGEGKLTQVAANGTLMPHPMLAVIGVHGMRLRGFLRDLGLNDAKKGAPDAKAPQGESRWAGLLSVTG